MNECLNLISCPFINLSNGIAPGADLSEMDQEGEAGTSPAPVSYAATPATPVPVDPSADTLVSSTETLLRNIQGLLKVAADNARQQERQISYEKGKHCTMFVSENFDFV